MTYFANSTQVSLSFSTDTAINCLVWTVTYANSSPVDLSTTALQFYYANTAYNSWNGIAPIVGPFPNDSITLIGDANGGISLANSIFSAAGGDYLYQVIGTQANTSPVQYMHGNLHLSSSLAMG